MVGHPHTMGGSLRFPGPQAQWNADLQPTAWQDEWRSMHWEDPRIWRRNGEEARYQAGLDLLIGDVVTCCKHAKSKHMTLRYLEIPWDTLRYLEIPWDTRIYEMRWNRESACNSTWFDRTPFCGMMAGMIHTVCGSLITSAFLQDLMRWGWCRTMFCDVSVAFSCIMLNSWLHKPFQSAFAIQCWEALGVQTG